VILSTNLVIVKNNLIGQSDEEFNNIEAQTTGVGFTAQPCAASLKRPCSNTATTMQQKIHPMPAVKASG